MNANRITFDTNVLVYAIDRAAGHKYNRAVELIDQAVYLDSFLTLQALSEFYASTTKKRYAKHDEAVLFITELMEVFPIVENNCTSFSIALETVKNHQIPFWDAMLWATAREEGCTLLLSEDFQHGFTSRGMKIINPFLSDKPIIHYLEEK